MTNQTNALELRMDELRQLISRQPDETGLHWELASIHMQRGELVEARAQLTDEIIINPSWPQPKYDLAVCQTLQGDFEAAARLFDAVNLAEIIGKPEHLALKGDVYRALERLEDARDAYFEGLRKTSLCAALHYGLSLLSHFPGVAMERPQGFAPPQKRLWVQFEGLRTVFTDDDGRFTGAGFAQHANRASLFRGNFVVVTSKPSLREGSFSLHAERAAWLIAERWQLQNARWIHQYELGLSPMFTYAEYRFGSPEGDRFGHGECVQLTPEEVEQLIGYRLTWLPRHQTPKGGD